MNQDSDENLPDLDIICSVCFQSVGPGIRHPCSNAHTIGNLKKLLMTQGLKTAEQVISRSLKEIASEQNSKTVKLSTGGPKLVVSLGKPQDQKQITSGTLFNIKRDLDLPESSISTILKHVRKDVGRSGVESKSSEKILSRSHSLNNYYTVEKVDFQETVKIGNKKICQIVSKDFVFVKDPTELVNHICHERSIHVQDALVRVGIDGGQGSLKVIMNIFDPAVVEEQTHKDSGVSKVIVLALVKNVQETHHNLKLIFEKAKINDLKCVIASDLKVLNIIIGISAHGGKHTCLYCNGTINAPGNLRTVGELKSSLERYQDSGSNPRNMKEFDNVIYPCLLDEDDEKSILEIIPPPELHILMKIVTTLVSILREEETLKSWIKSKGVHWHGYNGGGLDGQNSSKVLKMIEPLAEYVDAECPEYNSVVELLGHFASGIKIRLLFIE